MKPARHQPAVPLVDPSATRDLPVPERTGRMGRNPGRSKPSETRTCDRGMRTPGASSGENGVTSPGGEEPGIPAESGPYLPWFCRWGMKDELAFLRGLGHWRQRESVADRAQLLRGYLEGLALRRRWTGLECEPLECEARFLLGKLDGGRAA